MGEELWVPVFEEVSVEVEPVVEPVGVFILETPEV
jgi:hypothetical protein